MTPQDPLCALHPGVAAAGTCNRCGSFACTTCLSGGVLCPRCRAVPAAVSTRIPSSLPIVGVVFSVLGVCFPPFLIVGAIIGIIALLQNKGSLPAGIVSLVLPVGAIPVIGILAAIAIPNFLKFSVKAKQAECKTFLKS